MWSDKVPVGYAHHSGRDVSRWSFGTLGGRRALYDSSVMERRTERVPLARSAAPTKGASIGVEGDEVTAGKERSGPSTRRLLVVLGGIVIIAAAVAIPSLLLLGGFGDPPSPSPSPPPPASGSALYRVTMRWTMAGAVDDFDVIDEYRIKSVIANVSGVDVSSVYLTIKAGSVSIRAFILLSSYSEAEAVANNMGLVELLSNTTVLGQRLRDANVTQTVESIDDLPTVYLGPTPSVPQPPSSPIKIQVPPPPSLPMIAQTPSPSAPAFRTSNPSPPPPATVVPADCVGDTSTTNCGLFYEDRYDCESRYLQVTGKEGTLTYDCVYDNSDAYNPVCSSSTVACSSLIDGGMIGDYGSGSDSGSGSGSSSGSGSIDAASGGA